MNQRLTYFVQLMALKERSPCILIRSCVLGVYIAFSPFVFLHTAMTIAGAWLFRLNFGIVLATSCLVNNPWTMVPIYMADHMVGNYCLQYCSLRDVFPNPAIVEWFTSNVAQYVGSVSFSFWAFMLGGNLLGIGCAAVTYCILRYLVHDLYDNNSVV